MLGKGRQANRTGCIRHKVKERPNKRYDATVGREAISNCTHPVLSDAKTNVSALVTAKPCVLRLEVDGALDLSKVAPRQVRRATNEVRKGRSDRCEGDLRELTGGLRRVGWLVCGKRLLPTVWELARNTACQFGMLIGEGLGIGTKKRIPLCLELGPTLADRCPC